MANNNNLNIKVGIKLDETGISKQITTIEDKISKKIKIGVELNVTKADLNKQISNLTDKVSKDLKVQIKLDDKIGYINQQIRDLSKKITQALKIKLEIDASGMNVVTERVKKTQEQIQKSMSSTARMFRNQIQDNMMIGQNTYVTREYKSGILGTSKEDIQNSIRSVISSYGGEISKISLNLNEKLNLRSATVNYKDAMGKMITETMHWKDVADQATGQVKRVFTTTNTTLVNDMQKEKQAVEQLSDARNKSYNSLAAQKNKELNAVMTFTNWQKQMEGRFNTLETGRTRTFVNQNELSTLKTQFNDLANTFGKIGTATPQLRQQMASLSNEFKRINTNANEAGRAGFSFADMFVLAWKKMAIWLTAGNILFGVMRQFQTGVQYIISMNDAMVELAKVTDFTASQMDNLRQSAIDTGKALGKSSVDIMSAYSEAARIYKNPEAIKEMSRVAVMASNVTSLTAQEAAKSLNTTLLTFKLGVKDAASVLDQYNEIKVCLAA